MDIIKPWSVSQMSSERQRIEAPSSPLSSTPEVNMPPPPSYEEVSGVFASETFDVSAENVDYFLGEVTISHTDTFWYHDNLILVKLLLFLNLCFLCCCCCCRFYIPLRL